MKKAESKKKRWFVKRKGERDEGGGSDGIRSSWSGLDASELMRRTKTTKNESV